VENMKKTKVERNPIEEIDLLDNMEEYEQRIKQKIKIE
jgi:hypothetical protein